MATARLMDFRDRIPPLTGHRSPSDSLEGINERTEERRADKDFQDRLRRAVERNKEALDLLAK